MKLIKKISDWKIEGLDHQRPYGLVPTMGALHDGHLALIRRGRKENLTLIASIFVNPKQFGSNEDFDHYPKNTELDLSKLEKEGVDCVFLPSPDEMYPMGFATHIDPGHIATRLEGAHRDGHFRGVATVVTKLFSIFRPNKAYFGQKDFQQSLLIKNIVLDLNLDVEIIVESTVRDRYGLALSSRNQYLSKKEQIAARVLYKALSVAEQVYKDGVLNSDVIRSEVIKIIKSEPIAKIDYVSVCDVETLIDIEIIDRPAIVVVAARFGDTRLIDNIYLNYLD